MAGPALAEEVKIGSGAAAVENIFNKITEPMEKATGVKLMVVASGPVQAIKDLDAGTIEGAVGGVTFPDWMAMMEKEGYPIADKSLYKNRVIGKDLVKVITNKDVTVSALSKEQLAGFSPARSRTGPRSAALTCPSWSSSAPRFREPRAYSRSRFSTGRITAPMRSKAPPPTTSKPGHRHSRRRFSSGFGPDRRHRERPVHPRSRPAHHAHHQGSPFSRHAER
jgi:hypothetical protein